MMDYLDNLTEKLARSAAGQMSHHSLPGFEEPS